MTIQSRVNQIKGQIEQLRKNYASAAAEANKAVVKGLEKLADKELNAIRSHYEEALKGLKAASNKGSLRDIAQAQVKVLQKTLDRVVASARDSVKIINDTSKQVAKALQAAVKAVPAKAPAAKKPATKRKAAPAARAKASTGARPATRRRTGR